MKYDEEPFYNRLKFLLIEHLLLKEYLPSYKNTLFPVRAKNEENMNPFEDSDERNLDVAEEPSIENLPILNLHKAIQFEKKL